MASAEPSDTQAPLHAIKGDIVSILTRTAILIYPYLLRLGLPAGSLLRTILIRTSFTFIYWGKVSKFQTLITVLHSVAIVRSSITVVALELRAA